MRVLRHMGHLIRDRAHACPTYGGWTIEDPTQLSPTQSTTRPARHGALAGKQDI